MRRPLVDGYRLLIRGARASTPRWRASSSRCPPSVARWRGGVAWSPPSVPAYAGDLRGYAEVLGGNPPTLQRHLKLLRGNLATLGGDPTTFWGKPKVFRGNCGTLGGRAKLFRDHSRMVGDHGGKVGVGPHVFCLTGSDHDFIVVPTCCGEVWFFSAPCELFSTPKWSCKQKLRVSSQLIS